MMKKFTLCLMAAGLMAVGTASAQNGNTGKDRQNTCTTKQCVHGQVKKTTPADLTKHMKEVLNLSDQQEEKVLNLNNNILFFMTVHPRNLILNSDSIAIKNVAVSSLLTSVIISSLTVCVIFLKYFISIFLYINTVLFRMQGFFIV